MMTLPRAPRTAGLVAILVAVALWTAWLATDVWAETWEVPPVHRQIPPPQPESRPDESLTNSTSKHRISKLHYLIPTTTIKPAVCAHMASALLNRYSIPTIVGYKGKGEFDAHKAHIAKLKTAARYLHDAPEARDDDLVIMVDGFDVVAQIPAEATIQLYFDMMAVANQRVADQHGLTLEEARAEGLYQSLLWGTDKGCFPSKKLQPQCWITPDPPSPHNVWGPRTGNGELQYSPSKFLNSGTVIGPLGDLRNFLDAANEYIAENHEKVDSHRNSDQLYISKLYARQEFHRTMQTLSKGQAYPGLNDGSDGRRELPPKRMIDEETEYHITVDFESAFAQTQCHNDRFMWKLKYNNWDNSAHMKHDALDEGDRFRSYHILMPSYFFKAFARIWNSIDAKSRPGSTARDWVRSLPLGTNVATRRIHAFYHNTCTKRYFIERFRDFWFYPDIDVLLKTATQANRGGNPISAETIDGRIWVDAQKHPSGTADPENYGGVFTDFASESYLSFREACGESWEEIFKSKLPVWRDAPKAEA